jgi:hypothetical protein
MEYKLESKDHAYILRPVNGVLTIPEGYEAIDKSMIDFNDKITDVIMPYTLKVIGQYTFAYTNILSVYIPNSVEYIGDRAFYKSDLTDIELSVNLKYIGEKAFSLTNIWMVTIPGNIDYLNVTAFDENVIFARLDEPRTSVPEISHMQPPGIAPSNGNILPSNYVEVGKVFVSSMNTHEDEKDPSKYIDVDLRFVESIQSITIKMINEMVNLKTIGEDTFDEANVDFGKTYTINKEVKFIMHRAFYGAQLLNKVVLPPYIEYIGENAFAYGTTDLHIAVSSSVKFIGKNSFLGTEVLYLPDPQIYDYYIDETTGADRVEIIPSHVVYHDINMNNKHIVMERYSNVDTGMFKESFAESVDVLESSIIKPYAFLDSNVHTVNIESNVHIKPYGLVGVKRINSKTTIDSIMVDSDADVYENEKLRQKFKSIVKHVNNPPKSCFDVIAYGDENSEEFLKEEQDGIIFLLPKGDGYTAICSRRSDISRYINDPLMNNGFYECKQEWNSRYTILKDDIIPESLYIMIPLTINIHVSFSSARSLLSGNMLKYDLYVLKKSGKHIKNSVNMGVYMGGEVVSASHCQSGTDFDVYDIEPATRGIKFIT